MVETKGIIPALVTPFDEEGEINEPALRQLIRKVIGAGCHGIFCLGSNGEFFTLQNEEKLRVAEIAVDEAAGRVPVYAGTGTNSTKETIALNRQMKRIGVTAVSVITPYYVKYTQAELIRHYETLADESDLPIILYDIPGLTGNALALDTVARLAEHERIVAIKDSSGSFDRVLQCIDLAHDRFTVLVGTDSLILSTLMSGGEGAIAATANLLPEVAVAIYEKWQAGDLAGAAAEQRKLGPIRAAFKKATMPAVLKEALNQAGLPVGPPRLPTAPVTEEIRLEIRDIVRAYQQAGDITSFT